jgi:hypothetical protein
LVTRRRRRRKHGLEWNNHHEQRGVTSTIRILHPEDFYSRQYVVLLMF